MYEGTFVDVLVKFQCKICSFNRRDVAFSHITSQNPWIMCIWGILWLLGVNLFLIGWKIIKSKPPIAKLQKKILKEGKLSLKKSNFALYIHIIYIHRWYMFGLWSEHFGDFLLLQHFDSKLPGRDAKISNKSSNKSSYRALKYVLLTGSWLTLMGGAVQDAR